MVQQAETISAIATARGEGGIGIVRISGERALSVADAVFRAACGKTLAETETQRAVYGRIVDESGAVVDEAIALVMKAPHSYTKEDVVELQCHGGAVALQSSTATALPWCCGSCWTPCLPQGPGRQKQESSPSGPF